MIFSNIEAFSQYVTSPHNMHALVVDYHSDADVLTLWLDIRHMAELSFTGYMFAGPN